MSLKMKENISVTGELVNAGKVDEEMSILKGRMVEIISPFDREVEL